MNLIKDSTFVKKYLTEIRLFILFHTSRLYTRNSSSLQIYHSLFTNALINNNFLLLPKLEEHNIEDDEEDDAPILSSRIWIQKCPTMQITMKYVFKLLPYQFTTCYRKVGIPIYFEKVKKNPQHRI